MRKHVQQARLARAGLGPITVTNSPGADGQVQAAQYKGLPVGPAWYERSTMFRSSIIVSYSVLSADAWGEPLAARRAGNAAATKANHGNEQDRKRAGSADPPRTRRTGDCARHALPAKPAATGSAMAMPMPARPQDIRHQRSAARRRSRVEPNAMRIPISRVSAATRRRPARRTARCPASAVASTLKETASSPIMRSFAQLRCQSADPCLHKWTQCNAGIDIVHGVAARMAAVAVKPALHSHVLKIQGDRWRCLRSLCL